MHMMFGGCSCFDLCPTPDVDAWISFKFLAATSRAEEIALPIVLRAMRRACTDFHAAHRVRVLRHVVRVIELHSIASSAYALRMGHSSAFPCSGQAATN